MPTPKRDHHDPEIAQILADLSILEAQWNIRHKVMTCLRLESGFRYSNSIRSKHHESIDIDTGVRKLVYKRFHESSKKTGNDIAHQHALHAGEKVVEWDDWSIEELVEGQKLEDYILQSGKKIPEHYEDDLTRVIQSHSRHRRKWFGHIHDIHKWSHHKTLKEFLIHTYFESLGSLKQHTKLLNRIRHIDRYFESIIEEIEDSREAYLIHWDIQEGLLVTDEGHVVLIDYSDMHYSTVEHDIAPLWIYESYFDIPLYQCIRQRLESQSIYPQQKLVEVFGFLYVLGRIHKEKHESKKWIRVIDSMIWYRQGALWKGATQIQELMPRKSQKN